jgi:hypothetical protein
MRLGLRLLKIDVFFKGKYVSEKNVLCSREKELLMGKYYMCQFHSGATLHNYAQI